MSSNTFRQIMLNETSSQLQSTSPKIKSNVTVILQMHRTIFQSLKVLINHKKSNIVSLWYLCELILCWIETPIYITSVINWWLRFDIIDGSWFFSAWNLYHICHITNSFRWVWCMRKMKDHQTKNHMLIILAFLTTDVNCAYWPLLQFLLSTNAYLKDGVCKFVVSFA